jgi:hypothetical protein
MWHRVLQNNSNEVNRFGGQTLGVQHYIPQLDFSAEMCKLFL